MEVYKITCITNGKVYVGISKNANRRWKSHQKATLRQSTKALCNAIRKHGVENFNMEIIAFAKTATEAGKLEVKFIRQLNSLHPNGYNNTTGGDYNRNAKLSIQTQVKISNSIVKFWKDNPEKLRSQAQKRAAKAWLNPVSRIKLLKGLEKARSSRTEVSSMKMRDSMRKRWKDPIACKRMSSGWKNYVKKYKGTKVLSDRTKRAWITRRKAYAG